MKTPDLFLGEIAREEARREAMREAAAEAEQLSLAAPVFAKKRHRGARRYGKHGNGDHKTFTASEVLSPVADRHTGMNGSGSRERRLDNDRPRTRGVKAGFHAAQDLRHGLEEVVRRGLAPAVPLRTRRLVKAV